MRSTVASTGPLPYRLGEGLSTIRPFGFTTGTPSCLHFAGVVWDPAEAKGAIVMISDRSTDATVYFRNPRTSIHQLVDTGVTDVIWDQGMLVHEKIDPIKHADLYFAGQPWNVIVFEHAGAAHYKNGDTLDKPTAVYPVWSYLHDDQETLIELCETPLGDDKEICDDISTPVLQRPVFGQDHIVFIADMPSVATGMGRKLIAMLVALQRENPGVRIHPHGMTSYRTAFGLTFKSVDIDPTDGATKGKIILPMGKIIGWEQAPQFNQWVKLVGVHPSDLDTINKRVAFNIRSAKWAAGHWDHVSKFRAYGRQPHIDAVTPSDSYMELEAGRYMIGNVKPEQPGDQFHCDSCSISDKCRYYREGAVCSVPGSEPVALSKFFGTRDSSLLITGLGKILQLQADRVQQGMSDEEMLQEMSPEVSKQLDKLFANGVKLAKLVDPSLTGAKVSVQVGVGAGGTANINTGLTPQQVMAQVVQELENSGIARENITQEMILTVIRQMESGQQRQEKVIQGELSR